MAEAFLVGGVRTPVGRYGGALAGVRPDDLAALVVAEAVRRAGVDPDAVDEVVLGAANQAGEDNRNVARMAVLLGGLPLTTSAYTVNRLCASGLTAIANAAQAVRTGEADVVVAGGVESMTRAPWVMAKPGTPWAKPGEVHDSALGWRFVNARHDPEHTITLGETAERVARLDGITREQSDMYGLQSQERAAKAIANGAFDAEIVPVSLPARGGSVALTADETPRATTMDAGLEVLDDDGRVPEGGHGRRLGADQVDLGAGTLDPGEALAEGLRHGDPAKAEQVEELHAWLELVRR